MMDFRKRLKTVLYPTTWKRRIAFLYFDLIAFSASLLLAFWIRFDFGIPADHLANWGLFLSVFLAVKISFFLLFRLYDISWRHFSLRDLMTLLKAALLAQLILAGIIYASDIAAFRGFPRSVLLVDLLVGVFISSALRISKRVVLEIAHRSYSKGGLRRTIIIGAGNSGDQLLRDLFRRQPLQFFPLGFVDDDPVKKGLYIQGIPVLGTTEDLPQIIREHGVDSIIIAVPSADRSFHRAILNLAKAHGVRDVKVVSAVNDLSNLIRIGVKDLRDIDITDLIGRQAVSIDASSIRSFLKNKRVLITGASGSIGSEIARQVCFYEPAMVGLLDVNESDLANLLLEVESNSSVDLEMFLCDISDRHRVEKVVSRFRPEVIFHAAAYKHVPVMERFPEESVRVNILGTYYLAKAALKYQVQNFVLISTDKAVNPTSIMGASKRIAEYVVTDLGARSQASFVAVRFGNVIGSRGSVLPIFVEQIKRGGPVTITHPEMRRYFMTIQESVALVLQAAATGTHGDVFVLDMGEPLKIIDLAQDLIRMNNMIPNVDIKIEIRGMREGEKLFEELLTAEEGVDATAHAKLFKARLSVRPETENIDELVEEFYRLNGTATKQRLVALFRKYIPSYRPSPDELSNTVVSAKEITDQTVGERLPLQ